MHNAAAVPATSEAVLTSDFVCAAVAAAEASKLTLRKIECCAHPQLQERYIHFIKAHEASTKTALEKRIVFQSASTRACGAVTLSTSSRSCALL